MRVSAGVPPEEDIPFAILQQMERDYNEQQQAAGAGQGGAHGNVSVFFAPSYTKKPESLPRQARDNTGTAEKKEYFSAGAGGGGEDADPDDVSSESDEESDLPSKLSRGWCVALSQRTAVGTESNPRSLLHVVGMLRCDMLCWVCACACACECFVDAMRSGNRRRSSTWT